MAVVSFLPGLRTDQFANLRQPPLFGRATEKQPPSISFIIRIRQEWIRLAVFLLRVGSVLGGNTHDKLLQKSPNQGRR